MILLCNNVRAPVPPFSPPCTLVSASLERAALSLATPLVGQYYETPYFHRESGLTASAPVSDVSDPDYTNGV